MNTSTLYIFSGLPASGKTTLAKLLAANTEAIYVRVDTLEQALRDLCRYEVETEGYELGYRIIRDNLDLGVSAVADSCNTLKITRDAWERVVTNSGVSFKNIEIRCSDLLEHQQRLECRSDTGENKLALTWQDVQNRYYEPWHKQVISIDTAGKSVEQSFTELRQKLSI